jgi:hypothetical protein
MSNNTSPANGWTPAFKTWPTFELAPKGLQPEPITPLELKRQLRAATRHHEATITNMALAAIMGAYRCEIHSEGDIYPCVTTDDFYIMDEHHVQCFSHSTGEEKGRFLFIPNNGSPAESFADWSGGKTFSTFMDAILEAFDDS